MDFSLNRMSSTQKEIEWQWERVVKENIDFSEIRVNGASCDFEANLDYFNLTDTKADQISFIRRRYEFFEQAVGLRDFRLEIFQLNWDVNSDDFAQMLTKALAQTANLLASVNNFPARMITRFAEIAPEEVRSMYIELYDESKDLYERVANFKNKSNTLLERYGNGAAQHYQYENAIMTYLWLRYPDKYYIYRVAAEAGTLQRIHKSSRRVACYAW